MSSAHPAGSPSDPAPAGATPAGAHRKQATLAWAAWLVALASGLIGAAYVAAVDVTGQASETALVLTTLILATTFTPIKQGLEKLVARRLVPAPMPAVAGAGPVSPIAGADELDRRIAVIARRVSQDVVAEMARAGRVTTDDDTTR